MPKKKATSNSLVKARGLFDHINHIREKQDPNYYRNLSDLDRKSWSNFMICRFLSMQSDNIESINDIQKYQSLPPEYFYKLCIMVVPLGRAFFPYIKGKKDNSYTAELIDLIRKHFNESKRNVLEYLGLMTKKEIREIVMLYGNSEEEADTLLSS
jgi:hypothetical protein